MSLQKSQICIRVLTHCKKLADLEVLVPIFRKPETVAVPDPGEKRKLEDLVHKDFRHVWS